MANEAEAEAAGRLSAKKPHVKKSDHRKESPISIRKHDHECNFSGKSAGVEKGKSSSNDAAVNGADPEQEGNGNSAKAKAAAEHWRGRRTQVLGNGRWS